MFFLLSLFFTGFFSISVAFYDCSYAVYFFSFLKQEQQQLLLQDWH